MAAPPFLRIEGLTRRYGDRIALDRLDLSVERGAVFGVLGPNGAGKSTTFQILAGLCAPDAGRIFLDGVEVRPEDPSYRARLGVVFQHPSLDGKLSASENLGLGAALAGIPRREARGRIDELLAAFDLSDRGAEPVERFSGGLRRRLELARVLLGDPELLIMDEPSAGLDQASLRRFWTRIHELRAARGLTVLCTTHQPEEAEQCQRLAILDRGRLVAEGTPEELRCRVGGDVITIEADAPQEIVDGLAELGLAGRIVDRRVVIECPRAHELIPRIVENFPTGRLRAIGMRLPSLGDAFVKLTGRALADDDGAREGVPGKAVAA